MITNLVVYYNTKLLLSGAESQKSKLGQQGCSSFWRVSWGIPLLAFSSFSRLPAFLGLGLHHCDSASLLTTPQKLPPSS